MEPTVQGGDRIWVAKAAGGWRDVLGIRATRPSRGDVIVFRYPRDRSVVFIKRLIGLPAETVELRGKQVIVNGAVLGEPYARSFSASRDSWGPKLVPAASYFVLGDNLDASNDSRAWGFVPEENLVGRAGVVYWSSDPQDGRVRWERIGTRLQ
jgi:signal peptidase I